MDKCQSILWGLCLTNDMLAVLGAVGGLGTFAFGVWQYTVAQIWKRREFVAGEIEKILSDPASRNALLMLDYRLRTITLFPDRSPEHRRWARLNRDYVAAMLIPHTVNGKRVEERPDLGLPGAAIRDCFDQLFVRLDMLQSMVGAKLIEQKDISPYISYWIGKLAPLAPGDASDQRLYRNLRLFINEYGYRNLQELCDAMERPIRPRDGDEAGLRADCRDPACKQIVADGRKLIKDAAQEYDEQFGEK